uniref:Secreted protein n=1 Tax=Panagrellus redivivus TaxID=6233 RepID=A0A7E4VP05_PANRE
MKFQQSFVSFLAVCLALVCVVSAQHALSLQHILTPHAVHHAQPAAHHYQHHQPAHHNSHQAHHDHNSVLHNLHYGSGGSTWHDSIVMHAVGKR